MLQFPHGAAAERWNLRNEAVLPPGVELPEDKCKFVHGDSHLPILANSVFLLQLKLFISRYK